MQWIRTVGLLAYRLDGTPIVSVFLTDEEWKTEALNKSRDLFMPETKSQAVPKVSRLGHRFFSHKPGERGLSQTGVESADHVILKIKSLFAATAAGWSALPEQSGATASGKFYRADVLCTHPNGKSKVAIEIQRSTQRDVDYEERQRIYVEAGIRCIWIDISKKAYRHHISKPTKALPRFECKRESADSTDAYLVSIEKQDIDFSEFILGALCGKLRFIEHEVTTSLHHIRIHRKRCWSCKGYICLLDPEFTDDLVRQMPKIVSTIHRKTSHIRDMCRIKQIHFKKRGVKEHVPCCPHCGIAQTYSELNHGFELADHVAFLAIARPAGLLPRRFWSWETHPKLEMLPVPGTAFLITGEPDDDSVLLDSLCENLKGCHW